MIQNRGQLVETPTHEVALDCIEAGIAATQPERAVRDTVERTGNELTIGDTMLDLNQYATIVVIGGGKAAAQMARVVEEMIGERITKGIVVTNDPVKTDRIEVVSASHPTPDETGIEGTQNLLSLAEQATEDTLVLCLISGGGSALLSAPAGDIALTDLQSLTDDLLSSGATIHEINVVRKHLSAIKGGQLATAASPATVIGLVLSDVVGNDLGVIASGPTVPDTTTYDDARSVLQRYDITPPDIVKNHLERGTAGELPETPTSDEKAFERTQIHVLADGFTALEAARSTAESHGYTPIILSSRVEGEAREAAKTHVAIAEESRATDNPVGPPVVFLSGGETTVTMEGDGTGGPNQEFALSGALALDSKRIVAASVDTDGSDGATDVAGALIDGETIDDIDRARTALAENNAYPYLADREAVIETGPTGTRIGQRETFMTSVVLASVCAFVFPFAHSNFLVYIVLFGFGIALGPLASLWSPIVLTRFGSENATATVGLLNIATAGSAFLAPLIVSSLQGVAGGYVIPFITLGVITILGGGLFRWGTNPVSGDSDRSPESHSPEPAD